MNKLLQTSAVLLAALPTLIMAETVGVFFARDAAQIEFAAHEVKAALESKQFTVEMRPLSALTAAYDGKKVVIALASDPSVTALLAAQKGNLPAGLGAQAFGLRTTATPQKSFWALGGDANGAMYGGLQLAENIRFADWHAHDAAVLKEYSDLGGKGTPSCATAKAH